MLDAGARLLMTLAQTSPRSSSHAHRLVLGSRLLADARDPRAAARGDLPVRVLRGRAPVPAAARRERAAAGAGVPALRALPRCAEPVPLALLRSPGRRHRLGRRRALGGDAPGPRPVGSAPPPHPRAVPAVDPVPQRRTRL